MTVRACALYIYITFVIKELKNTGMHATGGDTGKSAIAEHQWDQQHQVNWEGTGVVDRASRPVQLRVKEALYIQKTPTNNRLNHDEGYELPGGIATVKKLGGGVSSSRASTNHISAWTSAQDCTHAQAQKPRLLIAIIFTPCFTFALRMTRASSRNSKLYTELKKVFIVSTKWQ